MKAPHRGVMRLFHRKSVINSKNCFLNGFFARNLQNPGLNRQKQQNLRLFTNKCTPQQAPAFFTLMSRVSDINSKRCSIDCQSGDSYRFYANQKTLCGILYANQKNAGWYKRLFFRCAKTTCDIPATYIIYYICVVAFLKEISLLYKGDTEKQSLLYIGDSESESQKHDRLFKAVFS